MTEFPGGKRFAFSVFDDTDGSTIGNVAPVYRLLAELGIRTTKSVWPLPNVPGARVGGSTLADKDYLEFILWLQSEGFEVALHNARNHDSQRSVTLDGLARFHECLGRHPRTHCNHQSNKENIYWGADRLSSTAPRCLYNLATRFRRQNFFQGHVEKSPYFWGDVCKQHIDYVRNFVFDEINLLNLNPTLPYHDPSRPWVNYWFSSSEGGDVSKFCGMLSERRQDRLAEERGVCIMYTHFSDGFCSMDRVRPEFERLMRRLSRLDGWFVPVCDLLDYLRAQRSEHRIPRVELRGMERRWLMHKLRRGTG